MRPFNSFSNSFVDFYNSKLVLSSEIVKWERRKHKLKVRPPCFPNGGCFFSLIRKIATLPLFFQVLGPVKILTRGLGTFFRKIHHLALQNAPKQPSSKSPFQLSRSNCSVVKKDPLTGLLPFFLKNCRALFIFTFLTYLFNERLTSVSQCVVYNIAHIDQMKIILVSSPCLFFLLSLCVYWIESARVRAKNCVLTLLFLPKPNVKCLCLFKYTYQSVEQEKKVMIILMTLVD